MSQNRYVGVLVTAVIAWAAGCSSADDDSDHGGFLGPDASASDAKTDVTVDASPATDATTSADAGDAEAIEQHSGGYLHQRVAPEERAQQEPQLDGCQTECVLELRARDGDADPVEIVDQDAGAEQTADAPAKTRYARDPASQDDADPSS